MVACGESADNINDDLLPLWPLFYDYPLGIFVFRLAVAVDAVSVGGYLDVDCVQSLKVAPNFLCSWYFLEY